RLRRRLVRPRPRRRRRRAHLPRPRRGGVGRARQPPRRRRQQRMTRPLGRRLRAAAPYAVLAAVLLLVGWLTADRRAGGPPLDPRSTAPDGTKALVDTLERLGAEVVVTGDLPDASTA